AVVAEIALGIPVAVGLVLVRDGGAVVARVAQGVGVGVRLRGVGRRRAVVVLPRLGRVEARARADPVAVLVVQRVARARIAGVTEGVAVRVGLARVGDGRAVVVLTRLRRPESDPGADAVGILVVERIAGAEVAHIAEPVRVSVRLVGIGDGRAVVVIA